MPQVEAILRAYLDIVVLYREQPHFVKPTLGLWCRTTGEVEEFLHYVRQLEDHDEERRRSAVYWLQQGQGALLMQGLQLLKASLVRYMS